MSRLRAALAATMLLLAGSAAPATPQRGNAGGLGAPSVTATPTPRAPRALVVRRLRSTAEPVPRIVNGVRVAGLYPTVGMLGRTDLGFLCSGTLIGCNTFLTAGHCILNPATPALHFVFLQHVGFVGVSSITRNPDFAFGVRSDEAVIGLSSPVSGVAPSLLNTVAEPPPGALGDIVGFGSVGELFGPGTSHWKSGIKRRGDVVTAECVVVPESSHLCWNFTAPIGAPGTDSNTCKGDSGGPLFADIDGLGVAIAGITSGGNSTCLPEDQAFDADVHFDHQWIESVASGDLAPIACGATPPVLGPDTQVLFDTGSMADSELGVLYEVVLPAGRSELRVTTNGELAPAQNFDLYVKHGGEPAVTPADYDCASTNKRSFEACSFPSPAAGSWFLLVSNPAGHQGEYDVTVSILGGPTPTPTFTPSATATATPTSTATPPPTPTPTPTPGPCARLDVDGDGEVEALSDGILGLRGLLGFTGLALTTGALSEDATRDAGGVSAFLTQCAGALDVDGDGMAAPLTDGLLLVRYLFGLRGAVLASGAVGEGCTRCDSEAIEPYLAALTN